jgi:glycerophosphoryl diester phosphodiesterase
MDGPDERPLVIAHRTCALDAPENSVEGIRLAATLGADAVEFDVRRCRGGIPVLMHDAVPWRTARLPFSVLPPLPVRAMSLGAFRRLRLRGGGHAPTLADAVANLPPGLQLAFDIKDAGAMGGCIETVLENGLADRAMLWCQDPQAVALAGNRAPAVRRALLRYRAKPQNVRKYFDDAAAVGSDAVILRERLVTPAVVAAGKRLGLSVYAWVQSLQAHEPMLAAGVDGLITDWPAQARRLVDR